MSSITLNLDPVALREATSQAIMGLLTPEMKTELIRTSIQNLLAPSTNSWDRGKSPLQQAFDQAINWVAKDACKDLIEKDDEIKTRIDGLVREVAVKLLDMDRDKLTERMAEAFVNSLKTDR